MTSDLPEIRLALDALLREKTGDRGAHASAIEALPGHAGLSYSFFMERTAAGASREKLVIRLAPKGVRIAGPADVARQARIMASLADTDIAVPPVRWIGDGDEPFGRPYFMVGFVEGEKIGEGGFTPGEERRLARSAVQTMAALHALEWEPRRKAWGEPFPLADELGRLHRLLDRPTLDPALIKDAPELARRLRRSLPENPRIGCVHGDFQWSNCLFRDGRLVALIDWELARVSAVALDLGWLCLFSDRSSWVGDDLVRGAALEPAEIVAAYAESARFPVSAREARWFQAFSGYRFGVITAFNLMLHRRGKRPDPMWEVIALSAPRLFERGLELLDKQD